MSSELVSIESQGAIAILTLDRPPANAIDLELARRFDAAFDEAMATRPRALVLTGSGRFFSGGLDLKSVPAYSPSQQRELIRAINCLIGKLYACPVPVIGGINGHAVAGGLIVALIADYRVGASGDFQLGLTEARVGIPFPAATMIVLQSELSPANVRFMTLFSRTFGPEEARVRGVLDELRPLDAVRERAGEVARELASIPADAYRRIKHQVRRVAIDRIGALNAADADPMLEDWVSPEAQSASASILRDRGVS